jgi:hypothetical protein
VNKDLKVKHDANNNAEMMCITIARKCEQMKKMYVANCLANEITVDPMANLKVSLRIWKQKFLVIFFQKPWSYMEPAGRVGARADDTWSGQFVR